MSTARLLSALAGRAARRPLLVLALAAILGAGGAALALSLHTSAASDTFVGRSSATYRATQRFYRAFGEEPVEVMVKGSLQQLLLSSDLERLTGLEGCLSGNVPAAGLAHEGGPEGPCGQLGALHTVKVVIGPGTFLQEAAEQIDQQLSTQSAQAERQARAAQQAIYRAALAQGRSASEAHKLGAEASKLTLERYAQQLELIGAEYGLTAPPEVNDPAFIERVVFDNTAKLPGTPKQRFAYLFPSREAALISVRMRAGLDEAQRNHTIALIRRAVAMPEWQLQHGERYLITGEPVIVSDLTSSIARSIELLLVAVLLVMAITLTLVFRGRPRLLPLALAALATALTFGALAAVGASLTVAQVAVLPVLVGLAVDYAIQFQSRFHELRRAGARVEDALRQAAALAGPTIAAAAAAGAAALLVLALSPVPTVRGFGFLLALGIAIAFLCALTVGSAALALAARRGGSAAAPSGGAVVGDDSLFGVPSMRNSSDRKEHAFSISTRAPALRRAMSSAGRATLPMRPAMSSTRRAADAVAARLVPSLRGARELLRDNALTRAVSRAALVHAVRHPGRVLGVGLALAALGWALDTQTHVETNLEKLVPQNLSSLRNLNTLERTSGIGGEIDLMVSGAKRVAQPAGGRRAGPLSNQIIATPATLEWMSHYEAALLRRFGYSATRGCGKAQLCPAFSLPDLFAGSALTGSAGEGAGGSGAGGGRSGTGKAAAPKLTSAAVRSLLGAIPSYFSQDVITSNRRVATLAFGIRLMPLDRQQQVIDAMRASLHPPRGVSVQLVGLPVLAAQSGAIVASPWRRVLTLLAGLAAAALVLLAAFRGDRRRALAPLVPVALATGWSALIVFAIRVPLNPMSVTLSALVIAISTEFSVLLSERHRQERIAGYGMLEALRRAYNHTGAAVAASAVTAIMGFGVLVLSDITMLRDFGLVTLIDLSASLLGVLVALPAALLLAEPGGLAARLPRRATRRRGAAVRPRDEPA
ncbi:MAG TPA: MMPL family transporter [Solirubrobacteraceae bacterium]|nr:MMPL family transporter [Solirubrobacteraceae bacterium]